MRGTVVYDPEDPARRVAKRAKNPARVYLAGLAKSGRRTVDTQLRGVAKMVGATSVDEVPFHLLLHEHVVAIRSKALELSKSPATGKSLLFYTENLL